MDLTAFSIKHFNNTLVLYSDKEAKFSSEWFMDFGKFGCEIFNQNKKIVYKVIKQFQFWKWQMVYYIKKNDAILSNLISQNNRKTIYAIDVNEITYEVKVHYKKKLSIYKNGNKIAEVDESFSDEDYQENIKFLVLDTNDLEVCFLLFSCIKIGEVGGNKKPTFTSQKELEVNEDPWS